MVCMSPHAFVLYILVSALASSLMLVTIYHHTSWEKVFVASRHFGERLQLALRRVGAGVSLSRSPSSRRFSSPPARSKPTAGLKELFAAGRGAGVKASEIINRATLALVEPADKAPARYVRAFCGNKEVALKRWRATLRWRQESNIDSILGEPQPFFRNIRRCFPSHISGKSRSGNIVVFEKLGKVDIKTLKRKLGVTVPDFLRHWTFVSEYMYRVLQPTDSAQQVTIVDVKGLKIQSVAGDFQEYLKKTAQLARTYYVERSHKVFVVNAPAWFGLSFRVVSPFLSPRTKQKIRILGSDLTPLLDEIEPQFLPVEYGGLNTTPVEDSPEERDLRRLVAAINISGGGNDEMMATTSRPTRRSPGNRWRLSPDTTLGGDEQAPALRSVEQSPCQRVSSKARPPVGKEEESPATNRSRAQTYVAYEGFPDQDCASQSLRRATWPRGDKVKIGAVSDAHCATSGRKDTSSRATCGCGGGGVIGTGESLEMKSSVPPSASRQNGTKLRHDAMNDNAIDAEPGDYAPGCSLRYGSSVERLPLKEAKAPMEKDLDDSLECSAEKEKSEKSEAAEPTTINRWPGG